MAAYVALTHADGYVYRAIGGAIRDIQIAIAPHPLPLRKKDRQLLAALLGIPRASDETTANKNFRYAPTSRGPTTRSSGAHGQTLKYCPITVDPCYETDRHFSYQRIDDTWIWLYSSAL